MKKPDFEDLVGEASAAGKDAWPTVARWGRRILLVGGVAALVVLILKTSWRYAGPIATILYAFLFVVGLAGIPTIIMLAGPSFPNALKGFFGKINFVFAQLANGHGYLVQFDDCWKLCIGEADKVWIDGEWREIDGGTENMSVLGWQPFGILRYKDDGTLQEARVDPAGMQQAQTDGGSSTTRGGYTEVSPDADISGMDGTWLIDLKRVFSRGLKKIGDIALIEKAEEVAMREEARSSRVAGYEPIIGSAVGILLGVMTGYVFLAG